MVASSLLDFDVVDVFADQPYSGNQLAVVHGTAGLSTGQLQAIAAEFNFSETAFPEPIDATSYRLRIFTPGTELPFAGHPTVGAASTLNRRGQLAAGAVVQHCRIGAVRVDVDDAGAELSVAPRQLSGSVDANQLLESMGLTPRDLARPARLASCGLAFVYVPVHADRVAAARPLSAGRLSVGVAHEDPLGGVCVYAVEPQGADAAVQVHARVFCPEVGVPEDPATGSAAAGLGLVLVADGLAAADAVTGYRVRQGIERGRPSLLLGRVDAHGGRVEQVFVAGAVHPVASGTLCTPPADP